MATPFQPSAAEAARPVQPLHLLLATVEDPHDPGSWSGTPFHMRQALEQRFARVTVLSSRRPRRSLLDAGLRLLLGRHRYPLWLTRTALRDYAKRLDAMVSQERPDAVLCISSQHLVHAGAMRVPTFMVSDAPWMAYKQAYSDYDALPLLAARYAAQEAAVARRISGVIYPTPWACREAAQRFALPTGAVDCIPFGANRCCALATGAVLERIEQKAGGPLQFLFVGKDWERKGGPLAMQIVRLLNQGGCPSRLVVIGCTPTVPAQDAPHVQVKGLLSPAKPAEQRALQAAYEEAHFFLVPSRAECFGLVFAEAQSYGLPCIALDSQGIPGVVDDGRTGLLFEPGTPVPAMVEKIARLAQDGNAYRTMARAARQKFDSALNWQAFGEQVHARIARACAVQAAGPDA